MKIWQLSSARDAYADFSTTDAAELLARPEVNAVIIATQESAHVGPVMQALEYGHRLFIEKPLAVDVRDSEKVAKAIERAGVDAVMGYTQRFRRRFLTVKERLVQGQIGDVTAVSPVRCSTAQLLKCACRGQTSMTRQRRS